MLSFPILSSVNADPTWDITTIDSVDDVGYFPSLALDSQNRPHISYNDWTNNLVKYSYWTGTTWNVETVASGATSSLALDSTDNPHVAYVWGGNLNYAHWDGSSWQTEIADSTGVTGDVFSLVLDSVNNPHITICDSDGLEYLYKSGASWNSHLIDSAGHDSSLVLDSTGNPHISYLASNLMYAYWTGSSWQTETVASSATGFPSLAVDSLGNWHIMYTEDNSGIYSVKYASRSGSGSWTVETVDEATGAGTTSLALDCHCCAHVCYWGRDTSGYYDAFRYAYWTGSNWHTEIVDPDIDDASSYHSSLMFDGNGNPHIAYFAYHVRDLKYACQINSVFFAAPESPLGTMMALAVPCVVLASYVTLKKRQKREQAL